MVPESSRFLNRIKSFLTPLMPPPGWRLPVIILLGIMFGMALHVIFVSDAISYLSEEPRVCVNCHVMAPEYATWQRGSHGRVATCNDCHVPHNNIIEKYYFKAGDGLRHAAMFILRLEPQVIRIKDAGKKAVQENCIRCHANQIHPVSLRAINNASIYDKEDRFCWDCHRETPHGRVHGLTSVPFARVPRLPTITPDWMDKLISDN
jgi:cytochrome c nitrite reductase small subunit